MCIRDRSSSISNAPISQILDCGVGYRAKAIKKASIAVTKGEINFEDLKNMNYYDAKQELVKIFGIGNKVADCILLFSLNKLEAFPLDRWMIQILQKYYSKEFQISTKTITAVSYTHLTLPTTPYV